MATPAPHAALTGLLQSLAQPAPSRTTITPAHIRLLAQSLISTSPKSDRSLAYICLTKIVEDASSSGAERDQSLTSTFQPILEPFLDETEATTEAYLPSTALLAALFPLAPGVCSTILLAPLSREAEAPDALALLLELAELESPLQLALAELLVAATGTKEGREMVQSRAMEWLQGAAHLKDGRVSGVCSAALAKLRNTAVTGQEGDAEEWCKTMVESLGKSLDSPPSVLAIIEGLSVLSLRPAIKQLLASQLSFLKVLFGLLPTHIRAGSLPARSGSGAKPPPANPISYEPVDTSLCYGISTILVNLTSRKPVLSAEDEQMAKLRAMAESGQKGAGSSRNKTSDPLDEAPAVQERVEKLYKAGVVSLLSGLARAESLLVRQMLGKLCLNLVHDQGRRMEFIRGGGFKVLSEITRKLLAAYEGKEESSTMIIVPIQPSSQTPDIDILPALQAGARLIITTPPNLLYPPPHLTTSLNSLTPLYTLLTHPSSTLLQTFEALMGLTNLASISQDVADRIVVARISPPKREDMWRTTASDPSGDIWIISKVEEVMMDDNELVRRAATELVCNLAGSEKGFGYLSGESSGKDGGGRVKQRLKILMILMDVDDLPTRLAAGGALAILTESKTACAAILAPPSPTSRSASSTTAEALSARSAWRRIISILQPEEIDDGGERIALISTKGQDGGMLLRAGYVLSNLLEYMKELKGEEKEREVKKMKEEDMESALKEVLRGAKGDEDWWGVLGNCLVVVSKL